jgi:hypothetical protein
MEQAGKSINFTFQILSGKETHSTAKTMSHKQEVKSN